MLQRDTFSLPILKGMSTEDDTKLAQNDSFNLIDNWEFNEAGGLKKRNGLETLTNAILGGGTLSKPVLVDTLKDELVCISNGIFYAYSPSRDLWVEKGYAPQAIATNTPILSANQIYSKLRMVETGNYQIVVYLKTDGSSLSLYYATIDKQSGTIIVQDQLIVAPWAVDFELVLVSTKVYVLYTDYLTSNIKYIEIQGPNFTTLGTLTNLVTDNFVSGIANEFSACTDSTFLYLAYHNSTDNKVKVSQFNSSMVLQWGTSFGTAEPTNFIRLEANAQSTTFVGVVWRRDTVSTTLNAILNKSGAVTTAEQTIDGTNAYDEFFLGYMSVADNLEIIVNVGTNAPPYNNTSYTYQVALATGVFTGRQVCSSFWECNSHGITISDRTYYLWTSPDPTQTGYLFAQPVYDYIDYKEKYLGKYLTNAGESPTNIPEGKGYPILSGTKVLIPAIKEGVGLKTIVRIEAETTIDQKLNSLEFQNVLNISGGITKIYDGGYVTEMGFHHFPIRISTTVTALGLFPAGTYSTKMTYSWSDKHGQYWESAPCAGDSFAMALNNDVTFVISSIMHTEKMNTDIYVNTYMTRANGTTYYLANSTQIPQGNATVSVHLTLQVAGTERVLYTNGGVIENIAPPASLSFASSQNRLFIHSSDDKNEIWFSKETAKGYGIETSDSFVIRGDSVALKGDIESIAAMDEKVIYFKENSIYASVGQGPNATGTQGEFTLPQLVMADVGCPYPRSIVVTPQGLMFKSLKGIYTLGRGLQVEYTGVSMDAYNSEEVTSAQLMETKNQIRFTTQNRTMVFDYFANAWTTFTNFGAEDSAQWQNRHVIAVGASDNRIKYQGTNYTDNGVAVNTTIESAWIELKDLAGFQRINRMTILGAYISPHTLAMSVYNDYKLTGPDTYNVPVSTDGIYIARVHIKNQKCTSFRFKLVETNTATLGAGFTLTGFTFDVGIKKGLYKTPSTKQG